MRVKNIELSRIAEAQADAVAAMIKDLKRYQNSLMSHAAQLSRSKNWAVRSNYRLTERAVKHNLRVWARNIGLVGTEA